MSWSVRTKVMSGFAAALWLLLLIDLLAVTSARRHRQTVAGQIEAYEVLDELDGLLQLLQDAETGQRGFLLTGDERYLAPYSAAVPEAETRLETLRGSVGAGQRAGVDALASLVTQKLAELRDTVALRREAGFERALEVVGTGEGKRLMDEIRVRIADMKRTEREQLLARGASSEATSRTATLGIVAGSVLGAVCLVLALILLSGEDRRRAAAESALRASHDALETRIDERTAALSLANLKLREEIEQRTVAERHADEARDALARSRDELVDILDRLDLAVLTVAPDGRLTFASDAAVRLLGGASDAVKTWDELLPISGAASQTLREALVRGSGAERISGRMDIGGRRLWLDIEVLDDARDDRDRLVVVREVTDVHDIDATELADPRFHGLVGRGAAMQHVFEQIREVAAVDSTVLIEGETGTGKELTARAIHAQSGRASGRFVAVNVASLTRSLLASQLFGHRRGAFTGAVADHAGYFEAAHGGTIFLDEIGDVPLEMQTSLLRVLQEREVVRLGDTGARRVDVRVVAATQHDLGAEVAAGRFRADLLYRIRVARVHLPPLRARREDIPALVAAYLAARPVAPGASRVEQVEDDAMAVLYGHGWPGNVRELHAAIEYACIHSSAGILRARDLPPELARTVSPDVDPGLASPILAVLAGSGGNRSEAARRLGISRATFYRRLARIASAVRPGPRDRLG